MSLSEERLTADLTRAMKARDAVVVSVLRGVVAAAKNAKVEKRSATLAEADLVQIVRREVRQREEASEFARQAGREDLIEQNAAERAILESYLPATPTPQALDAKIREVLGTLDAPEMGAIMRALKAEYGAALDGREASQAVRRVLAEGTGTP